MTTVKTETYYVITALIYNAEFAWTEDSFSDKFDNYRFDSLEEAEKEFEGFTKEYFAEKGFTSGGIFIALFEYVDKLNEECPSCNFIKNKKYSY